MHEKVYKLASIGKTPAEIADELNIKTIEISEKYNSDFQRGYLYFEKTVNGCSSPERKDEPEKIRKYTRIYKSSVDEMQKKFRVWGKRWRDRNPEKQVILNRKKQMKLSARNPRKLFLTYDSIQTAPSQTKNFKKDTLIIVLTDEKIPLFFKFNGESFELVTYNDNSIRLENLKKFDWLPVQLQTREDKK